MSVRQQEALTEWAAALQAAAAAANHRQLVVLTGAASWGREQAALLLAGADRVLWLADAAPDGAEAVAPAQAHKALGRDLDGAVLDAYAGFDPDGFGVLSGAVRGGGLFLLICPPLADWPTFPDPDYRRIAVEPYRPEQLRGRFLRRLVRLLQNQPEPWLIEQGRPLPPLPAQPAAVAPGPPDPIYRTEDQRRAVAAVRHVVEGHRRRPTVLLADRGRGKSATFGIAAGELLREGPRRILVTGPRLDAVEGVFRHAAALLPHARSGRGRLRLADRELRFVAPDDLARAPQPADLLLVDEAAAIPTHLLERLLASYSRIAFASTVHGYEGTGRGFTLRFRAVLDRCTPRWRLLRLSAPIRWAAGDPLESFVFRALLLDAAAAPAELVAQAEPRALAVERLDRDALAGDEAPLAEVFGLLVQAHYRTRPFDLRHLLDGPNVAVYAARYRGRCVATAVVAEEGGLAPATVEDVLANRRRPRGHLVPESLGAHLGLAEGVRLRTARILRIAVHPALQGRGLGSRLLQELARQAAGEGYDLLASSFGATAELLRFWGYQGLVPVRVGMVRAASSGAHSVMVLRGLNPAGCEVAGAARRHLADQLPLQLGDPLRDLEPELAAELLSANGPPGALGLDRRDRANLAAFLDCGRGYGDVLASLWKWAALALSEPERLGRLTPTMRAVVMGKLLQRRDWTELADALDLPGRRGVLEVLRQAVSAASAGD